MLDVESPTPRPEHVRRRLLLSEPTDPHAVEILEGPLQPRDGVHLRRPHALPRIVVFLVGSLGAVRVPDLRLQVVVVLGLEFFDALPVAPLGVRVDVHFDGPVPDGPADVRDVAARAPVEDEGDGFAVHGGLRAQLVRDVRLGAVQDVRFQADVARGVDPVHVPEGGGHRVRGADGREPLVDRVDLLRLGVEVLEGRVGVVHPVLLPPRDAELHLQEDAHLVHPLQIGGADVEVLLEGLLREIDHVRGEEGLAVGGVEPLGGVEQPVDPREQLLGAVVRV
mmetsp:Transcript_30414/g.60158  ORF Transcript_30414/g.60158 Transcript_30414/m.60158 type:complete len:280 (-) Transcript_30414:158-997(-)